MALQHLRSSTANKRPLPANMADGQVAVNTNTSSPGLFVKDSAAGLLKIGPTHIGTTAPNLSPAAGGATGNTVGEQWLDTSGANPLLKVWDGSAWRTVQPVTTGTVVSTTDVGTITSTMILDETIANVDISTTASIAHSKLASITAGRVLLGNASNVPTATTVSGDITITSAGVTTVSNGAITNAKVSASAGIVDTKLATISTAGKVSNSATTATNGNTANAIVARDANGNFSAGTISASLNGNASTATNASTVTTNANLTGDVTSVGNATSIAAGVIVNADISASAAINYSKLAALNSANILVGSSTNVPTARAVTGDVTISDTGVTAIASGVIVNADVNASAAIAGTKISPNFGSQTITTTGVISSALGTAAEPSIAFTGDLNTGIYSPGADQAAVATNGSERARIDSSGRLLIGTSTALTSFVGATLTATPTFQNVGTTGDRSSISLTRISGTGLGPTVAFQRGSSDNVPGINTQLGVLVFNGFDGSDYRTAAQITVRADAATGSGDMPGRIEFATTASGSSSPTERLRITSAGLVGIGTSSPLATLHVQGGSVSASDSLARFGLSDAFNSLLVGYSGTGDIADDTPAIYVTNTTGSTGEAGNIAYKTRTGSIVRSHIFYTGATPTERLRITSAGRVGIGTSAPTHTLNVSGEFRANDRSYFTAVTAADIGGLVSQVAIRRGALAEGAALVGYHATSVSNRSILALFSDNSDTQTKQFEVLTQGDAYLRGSLGIGTTSPAFPLEIVSTSAGDVSTAFQIRNSDNGVGTASKLKLITSANSTSNVGVHLVAERTTVGGSTDFVVQPGGDERLRLTQNGTLTIAANTTHAPFVATIAASEVARIDSSGRLLVGTSTARSNYLGTQGAVIQVEGLTSTETGIASIRRNNETSVFLGRQNGSTNGANDLVSNNNNLGAINFVGGDGASLLSAASIRGAVDGTPGADNMPGRLVFSTTAAGASSPAERMRITNQGHIFVSQTSTVSPGVSNTTQGLGFDAVNNRLSVSRASGVSFSTNRNSDGTCVEFRRSGETVGSITVTTTNTAYNTSSDYRLKENVVDLDGAIDRLKLLPVHRFNFIADPDTVVDGFIAHEAAEVVPECVTGTKDEVDEDGNPQYQGIDQSKLVPLLTAALQEAIGEIESLKARVVALESA
jgi:hypothetical protein